MKKDRETRKKSPAASGLFLKDSILGKKAAKVEMEMKLWITRHGETTWNVENRVCGRPDVELTEKGKQQAKELALRVRGKGITRMLVSPLKRAEQTALLANEYIQVPVEIEQRLVEHSFGKLEGISRTSPVFWEAKRNITSRYPGGESVLEVAHRVYSLLDEIPEKYPGETILLVCHGAVSRVVHTYFEDIEEEAFHHYSLENCQLKAYEYAVRVPEATVCVPVPPRNR